MKDNRRLRAWELALMVSLYWWCVIFPPLSTATGADEAAETLSRQDEIPTSRTDGEYEIRFRILEIWEMVKEKMK